MQEILSTTNLTRSYKSGFEEVYALKDVNISVLPGQFIAVVGRSGSGKTTLLNLLGGLDKPTSGSITFGGRILSDMNEKDLTELRRHELGFVFQSFGLLPLLSAFENIELPLRIAGVAPDEREERTKESLEMVDLSNRAHHRPHELSGGEQQRIAIARAVVKRPRIILADEPTGELDSGNARSIFGLFKDMVEDRGISVLAATHDSTLLAIADEVKEIRNGTFVEDVKLGRRYRD